DPKVEVRCCPCGLLGLPGCRYAGEYLGRTGERSDGCATFWRRDRLASGEVQRVRLSEYGLRDNVALLVHLLPLPPQRPPSRPRSRGRDGSPPGSRDPGPPPGSEQLVGAGGVLVGNTHILFNTRRSCKP
ncbi:hypothetical protein V8C86DRAFT_1153561, partial [Haematococcus lacustris]